MRKIISAVIAFMMAVTSLAAVPVLADEGGADDGGEMYTAPESPAVTYNMNLDWKFKEGPNGAVDPLQTVMGKMDKDGKHFYDVDYDDSDWESVAIPHGLNGKDSFMSATGEKGGGAGRQGIFFYRKTFTVPKVEGGAKIFFEMEGIRQTAYVWINGQKLGYYEAGITAFGFDLTPYVTPGEQAVIAIANDSTAGDGNANRLLSETVPGEEWGSSYDLKAGDSGKGEVGNGVAFQWNRKAFNEVQSGLNYNAYLHVTGNVYQTFPLYNNLKTTGNYIYADDFDIRAEKATIHVDAEVRNESGADGNYTLEVDVVDTEGKLAYKFESGATEVKAAGDVKDDPSDFTALDYTAVEPEVYEAENLVQNPVNITTANTPDVTYIKAEYEASGVRFWSDTDPYLYTVYTILKDSSGKVVDVQKKDTGFRKVAYDKDKGVLINDKTVWLKGYAQRSTNEWAVIGIAPDWLQDYDMSLLKENNANFIRWMHVAPKPAEVRSSDRYGVIVVCPAGDQEKTPFGRQYTQRAEAMRDAMIYFRNSPSVVFWETGNNEVTAEQSQDMARIRQEIDPYGMRFIGARSTKTADQLNYDWNYAGTMYGNHAAAAKSGMEANGKWGPIMETEYARPESPRRVWDRYSPPDYDYVNKWINNGEQKIDGLDTWDRTQEELTVDNITEYYGYYSNRAGQGSSTYSAEAMMVWSDSNMHGRMAGSENCRTSGRVDPVRQTKEMFEGTRVAHSDEPAVHIIGHWSYPEVSDDTYNYHEEVKQGNYMAYTDKILKRDPTKKTVYAIGSKDVKKIELYRVDGETETKIGEDSSADSGFIYKFDNIDVTQGEAVIAKAYDVNNQEIATDEIARTYDAYSLALIPNTAVKEGADGEKIDDWRADGADVAYFDVQVLDKNGNVCALNYDRIDFTVTGDSAQYGTYLGGYNSGMGAGCFPSSPDSKGLSNYFGGEKGDSFTTLGKNFVFAENGTNRIFVRSTKKAGTFTLTANMGSSIIASGSITSVPVEEEGGLTLEMPSHLKPGLSPDKPVNTTVNPMMPLIGKFKVDWSKVQVVEEKDTNVYYTVKFGDTVLVPEADKLARRGSSGGVFGPIAPVLEELKKLGAIESYTENTDEDASITFKVTNGDEIKVHHNQIDINGEYDAEASQNVASINGKVYVSYAAVLVQKYIPGVATEINDTDKVITITYTAQ